MAKRGWQWHLFDQWARTWRRERNHLAVALTSAAFLEAALERLLRSALLDRPAVVKLFEGQGALSSASAKIDLAYGMGLISREQWLDMNLVRRVRNVFAHSPGRLSFRDAKVANLCFEMSVARYSRTSRGRRFLRARGKRQTPRKAFISTVGMWGAVLEVMNEEGLVKRPVEMISDTTA